MKDAVFDTLFVTSAKVRLIREGAYTENAQIAFENYPEVALAMMNLPKEERENAFAKMAKEATVVSKIFRLCSDGEIIEEATYTLPPKQALVAFVQQLQGNWETWTYPEEIPGMIQLSVSGRWSYTLPNGDMLFAK